MIYNSNNLNITGTTYSTVVPNIYDIYEEKKDPELFEKLVQDLILHKYADDDFKEVIELIDKRDVRLAIMSLIDKETTGDTNISWSEMKAFIDSGLSKMDHVKDVIKITDKFVKYGKTEKKQFGEVRTDFSLVRNMIDTLPKDVWSNPNLKWLDSCNGAGTFPFVVIYRLLKGLKKWEPDEEKLYKHIVENMIYTCELQSSNVFLWMCGVDPHDEYCVNAYWGSFLDKEFDYHMKNVWKIDKFDICLGNPPYNLGQEATGKRGGGDTLWDKFVIKSLSLLKENGYLCFVHPTLWRKPQSERSSSREVNSIMMKKQIHYLEMHNSDDGMKTFNAGTRYDFYLMENCPIYKTTKINDENRIISEVDLSKYDFIPNKDLEFFDKILAKDDDERCPIIFNRTNYGTDRPYVVDKKDEIYKYELIHSTPKGGTRYMYSSRNDRGHFGIPKVIFGDSGIYNVIIDLNGDYGMTQHSMAIKVSSKEEAESIRKVLLSEKFSNFLESVMWSNFQLDWRLFKYLKKDFWRYF